MSENPWERANAILASSAGVDDATPKRSTLYPGARPVSLNPPGITRVDNRSRFEAILRNTAPEELVAAARLEESEFVALYDHQLLVVRLPETDKTLAAGLRVTTMRGDAKPVDPSPMYAEVYRDPRLTTATATGTPPVVSETGLAGLLASSRNFVVPLRKRITAEAIHSSRISVGRAPNKDIVLRHESVSKDHCWFEIDDSGRFFVTDAGSKNCTRLNGRPVTARATPVQMGDILRFGTIDAMICSSRTLRQVLANAAGRAR